MGEKVGGRLGMWKKRLVEKVGEGQGRWIKSRWGTRYVEEKVGKGQDRWITK